MLCCKPIAPAAVKNYTVSNIRRLTRPARVSGCHAVGGEHALDDGGRFKVYAPEI